MTIFAQDNVRATARKPRENVLALDAIARLVKSSVTSLLRWRRDDERGNVVGFDVTAGATFTRSASGGWRASRAACIGRVRKHRRHPLHPGESAGPSNILARAWAPGRLQLVGFQKLAPFLRGGKATLD